MGANVTVREDFDFSIRLDDRIFPNGNFLHTVETYTGDVYGTIQERQLCRPDGSILATSHPEELECYRPFLSRVQEEGGTVLLLGMGLGMMANALLRLEKVTGITVLELDDGLVEAHRATYSEDEWWIDFVQGDAFNPPWLGIQCDVYDHGFASIWSCWDPQVVAPEADLLRTLYKPHLRNPLTCDRENWIKNQIEYNEQVPRLCRDNTTEQ